MGFHPYISDNLSLKLARCQRRSIAEVLLGENNTLAARTDFNKLNLRIINVFSRKDLATASNFLSLAQMLPQLSPLVMLSKSCLADASPML